MKAILLTLGTLALIIAGTSTVQAAPADCQAAWTATVNSPAANSAKFLFNKRCEVLGKKLKRADFKFKGAACGTHYTKVADAGIAPQVVALLKNNCKVLKTKRWLRKTKKQVCADTWAMVNASAHKDTVKAVIELKCKDLQAKVGKADWTGEAKCDHYMAKLKEAKGVRATVDLVRNNCVQLRKAGWLK